jgi:hypothetical protein
MTADPLLELAQLEDVAAATAAARRAVDARLRDRGVRDFSPAMRAQAALSGAQSSAALTEDPQAWLPGCIRLSSELLSLSALVRVAPGQVLARSHTLAARGVVPDAFLGRIRSPAEISRRMAALAELLVSATGAPAVVLAAVAHAEVATVEPFGSADLIVARAVEHMVLVSTGLDPVGMVNPETGHAAHPDAYRVALDGYRSGTLPGVRGWLLHCANAVAVAATLVPARA